MILLTLRSCDLEQDISTFPDGHDTVIGSKGIAMSTGQKQRVAIARAVYARNDFMIFDDVFSGLDVNTKRNVSNRLLGPNGLLKKLGTTVLIATHARKRSFTSFGTILIDTVDLLPFSDYIIALSTDGRVAEQGAFKELNAVDGYVRRYCLEHANDSPYVGTDSDENQASSTAAEPQQRNTPSPSSKDGQKGRQLGDWAVYKYYFDTVGTSVTIVFIVLSCGWAFFTAFPSTFSTPNHFLVEHANWNLIAVWLKWYADANATEPNKHNGYYVGVYSVKNAKSG